MNLDLTVPGNILGIFEELAPMDRYDAQRIARKLASWGERDRADDLNNGLVCIIPTRRLVEELTPYLRGHEVILEVCSGYGLLRRAFVDSGLLGSCIYYATDKYIDYEPVERIGQEEAVRKYHPSLVICSWPPPYPEVEEWLVQWDSFGVRAVVAISPWLAKQPKVGQLIANIPLGWTGKEVPAASREVVDVFNNISRVYILNKGLIDVKDGD